MNLYNILGSIQSEQRKVLVVGLGISGVAAARYLLSCGIRVVCVEREIEARYAERSKYYHEILELRAHGAETHFAVDGEQVSAFLSEVALCVLSPGVPLESAICGALVRHKVPVVSEFELGIGLSGLPLVVVTGSNGKSTTVSLIHHMLLAGGIESRLCGNVGIPVVSELPPGSLEGHRNSANGVLVVEASSYQLESCSALRPRVGIFLNLSENHLERHGTLERYFDVKAKLFEHQTKDDYAVINLDDARVKKLALTAPGTVLGFGLEQKQGGEGLENRAFIQYRPPASSDQIVISFQGRTQAFDTSKSRLIGLHNRYDMAASILAATAMGVSASAIQIALDTFAPLAHRLEPCTETGELVVINDSKSTTVAATIAAFRAVRERYTNRRIRLMLGGLSKAGSWAPLMTALKEEPSILQPVMCFGKDSRILADQCRAAEIAHRSEATLSEAIRVTISHAESGDVVLLSPGCASYDEFSDFEARGEFFKNSVASLLNPGQGPQ